MSAAEGVAVGLPPGLALCAKCGQQIKTMPQRGKRPAFPIETMALFNNFDYLLLLRRVGKLTYRVVGWR